MPQRNGNRLYRRLVYQDGQFYWLNKGSLDPAQQVYVKRATPKEIVDLVNKLLDAQGLGLGVSQSRQQEPKPGEK